MADRGFHGVNRYWPEALVKPMGRPQNDMDKEYFEHLDNNRVIVEQWNGRIKAVFAIMSDHGGYRGDLDILDDIVALCIAVYNQLTRLRSYPGYTAPDVRSTVPTSLPVPPGAVPRPAAPPKVHDADQLTGVTTVNFQEVSASRQWEGPFPNDSTPLV